MIRVFDALQSRWVQFDRWFGAVASKVNPYQPDKLVVTDLKPVIVEESGIRKRTVQVVLVASSAFLVWATFAPMDAGVNVAGKIMVSGKRKAVAHPSGGVVQEILVKEGDVVKQGQVLVRINPLTTEANLNDVELEYYNSLASESRLLAERGDSPTITWMPELLAQIDKDPRAKQAQSVQNEVFISGRSARTQERSILTQRITTLRQQLGEYQNVLGLKKEQLRTLSQEADNSKALASEGYVPLATANEVERQRNGLLASISTSVSQLSDTQAQIASTQLELIQKRSQFEKETNEKLTEVQRSRKSSLAKVQSLQFDRALTEIKAPSQGTVVGLVANTVGGVIKGAELLMEIVPEEADLIVEAQVPPVLIDKVRKGMEASMRFSAFNLRTTPVVTGTVQLVGADLLKGATPDKDYYLAQVRTTQEGLKELEGLDIQPGMPVDVIVKNGERTFMSYLIKPLVDSFALSFKD